MLHHLLFFINDSATAAIYTLSLHDALPISVFLVDIARNFRLSFSHAVGNVWQAGTPEWLPTGVYQTRSIPRVASREDRKSTRLNSSHPSISYAVFCLKKKQRSIDAITIVSI